MKGNNVPNSTFNDIEIDMTLLYDTPHISKLFVSSKSL